MPRTLRIAVIPGDGIGPEVIAEATKVLLAVAPDDVEFSLTEYPFGAGNFLATGKILDDSDLAELAKNDAILLGAVGGDPRDPKLAGGIIERGLLLKLRFAFDHYVNLRPTRLFPGVESPLANPATSTSSSCARAPKARTSATAEPSGLAPRRRSRPRCRSIPPTACSESFASASRWP